MNRNRDAAEKKAVTAFLFRFRQTLGGKISSSLPPSAPSGTTHRPLDTLARCLDKIDNPIEKSGPLHHHGGLSACIQREVGRKNELKKT